jgi:hypothetical protein
MHKSLPLDQDKLINFVLHHIHEWSKEFMEANPDYQYMLSDMMREDYDTFVSILDQAFKQKVEEFEGV